MTKQFLRLNTAVLAMIALTACGGSSGNSDGAKSPEPSRGDGSPVPPGQELMQTYCVTCHAGAGAPAGVDLSTAAGLNANASKSVEEIEGGDMPPERAAAPSDAERLALAAWLKTL